MSNLDEIFNMPSNVGEIQQNVVKKTAVTDPNLYVPKLEDAPDGVYKATLRFLPNIANVRKSTISKYTYWFTDATNQNGIMVDDPSTIGEKSPISALYWKLRNSKSAADQALADNINRNYYNYSLVYVVSDQQHPELVGKIVVFRYGKKIKDMIDSESNVDADSGEEPCNVFDLFNGKNFKLVIKKVGGYQNYDSSKFASISPIKIGDDVMQNTGDDKKKIIEFLKASPDLSKYEYKEWDEETHKRVVANIKSYTGEPVDEYENKIEATVTQKYEKEAVVEETPKNAKKVETPKQEQNDDEGGDTNDFFDLDDLDL